MVEHHLVACGNFAPARKILSEALHLLFGQLPCSPLYLLLHRAELLDLAQSPLNRLLAVLIGFALIGGQEGELDGGYCGFELVKPVVIHLWKDQKQQAGQAHSGEAGDTDTVKSDQSSSSSRVNEFFKTERGSDRRHENAKGCHHSGAGGKIPSGGGNKTENADNETQCPTDN